MPATAPAWAPPSSAPWRPWASRAEDMTAFCGLRARSPISDVGSGSAWTTSPRPSPIAVPSSPEIWALRHGAAGYPAGLNALDDLVAIEAAPPSESAPRALIGLGSRELVASIAEARAVTIVGARRATSYGRRVAEELAGSLAAAGLVVVSGMAFGIDSAAHRG